MMTLRTSVCLLALLQAACSSSSSTPSTSDTSNLPPGCTVSVNLDNGPALCSPQLPANPDAVPADVLANVCSTASSPDARTVMVIGDSFSEGVSTELRSRLGTSVNFCGLSSFGARTSDWMADRDLLDLGYGVRSIALAVLQRSDNPLVVVSIGSPDVGNDYQALGNDVYRKVHCDLNTVFEEFRSRAPTVDIALAGYDIANFNPGFDSKNLGLSCPEGAAQQTNASLITDPITGDQVIEFPRCVNSILLGLEDVFSDLADTSINTRYSPAYGVLQNRNPGDPDLDRFADPRYYRDCVHMNSAGQARFVDALESLGLLDN